MDTLKSYILTQVSKKQLSTEQAASFLDELDINEPSCTEYAIIGMSCRIPGALTPDEFWENLLNKKDSIGPFPKQRIDDVKFVNSKTFEQFKGLQCRVGGYLDRIDQFDHIFFKVTPAEARMMDPGQRLFLEVAVEALERAGLTEDQLKGSNTGVFVGHSINEDNYIDILSKDDPNMALGNQPSVLAYRLSFLYDMRGPTMVIDTACSSSLVALHQACQSIQNGDCDQAIVGGVNIRIFPAIREISNLGIEAFDGRCKTFDEKANGTNISDGVAAVVIKRRELAERDGDPILAVIKGSAVNSDGKANGITAPNPEAQSQVLKSAWKRAGIHPEAISFIETHGTGTKLGDPIEVLGLTEAFLESTDKKQFCALGAVKTNIGHLESTSGLAGLIKVVLSLTHRYLPQNIHFNKPNPFIDFNNSALYPASTPVDLSGRPEKLVAGLSSFGISGTNCHVVVEEYPQAKAKISEEKHTFVFSAKHEDSLRALLEKYLHWLKKHPSVALSDVAYTLAHGRTHYEIRAAFVAENLETLLFKIQNYLEGVDEVKESELALLYVQKAPIDWNNYIPNGRKIALPTYAFQQKRHWPKLEVENTSDMNQRLKSIFYQIEWVEEPVIFSQEAVVNNKDNSFLFFMQETPMQEAFADYVESQGISLIKVYPSSQLNYESIIAEALKNSKKPLGGVVHLFGASKLKNPIESWDTVQLSQESGAFSLFKIIRAMDKQVQAEWKLITVVAHAQKIGNEINPIDPYKMPIFGINKVASQEMPLVQSLGIDAEIVPSNFLPLFQEIFGTAQYSQSLIGLRQGKRWVQTLSTLPVERLPNRPQSIRRNGVYLIAGGAGYLGLSTAKLLAEKEVVTLILTGRKPVNALSEKQKMAMEEIRALGSKVIYLEVDVTQYGPCKKLIETIEKEFGTLNGIFVAIKNISHKRLDEVSYEFFRGNILSKVQGTYLLDHLTRHLPVDFMANFSSISSVTGGPTGGDCSASNLFLDSFGEWRNDQGLTTITMNYTLIEADDGSLLSDRMSMIPPITKEEFLSSLDLCLTKQMDFALIADFNDRVMSMVLPFMKIRFHADISKRFKDSALPFELPKETRSDITYQEIITILLGIWKEVLGYDTLESTANFFEIGGDSISAVKVLHLTQLQLQIKLEIADLYSYPILTDLAQMIDKKLNQSKGKQSLDQLLEDLQAGKIDLHQTIEAYEQLH